jgi:hypothetical protein
MRPAQINLTVYQYASFTRSFTWKSGSPPLPVDLTGCTARFMARVNHADAAPLISLTTALNAQGVLVIQPSLQQLGYVNVSLLKTFTATLSTAVTPYFQLFVDFPNGTTTPLVTGRIVILPEDVH